ncbi:MULTISPECIES: hypothetical protein [Thermomonospora]|uniref:Uncharacterized protein n=1 Tax=Thermomonospora curvata (strain ATCC 19995 / DSM 43183 / JCM 3096 / KCTC 9072 / NBRC 15933 / NCIMB 10081 / Henssen B9) TaxID=471852 RepID=D1A8F1_THECD|nr:MULTISPECIES: hypothetical protein [Thermomonospora]ACZ00466.1 hypothetical protein Tcur_4950 [Thermomonospora curvata DSM 43183]PKK11846.1 MAG: hypothetical protein BUE48_023930 [Thermomonospora sp. CIF 1]
MDNRDLALIGDAELIEELSMLTTQTARMRARMADIMAELDRRRAAGAGRPAGPAHRVRR